MHNTQLYLFVSTHSFAGNNDRNDFFFVSIDCQFFFFSLSLSISQFNSSKFISKISHFYNATTTLKCISKLLFTNHIEWPNQFVSSNGSTLCLSFAPFSPPQTHPLVKNLFLKIYLRVFFLSSWCSMLPTARRYTADNCTQSISMWMIVLRFLLYLIFFPRYFQCRWRNPYTHQPCSLACVLKLQLYSMYTSQFLSYAIIHINAPCTYIRIHLACLLLHCLL